MARTKRKQKSKHSPKHQNSRLENPDFSIVIPALNEEKRIGSALEELAAFINSNETLQSISIEILVVSADATDRTHDIVLDKKQLFENLKLLRPGPRLGKGRDVQYGMLRARGACVLFMDADLATPLRHLPKFYKAFTKGYDVVIGTRNIRTHHSSGLRIALSNLGNMLFRVAGGLWVEDSQCGFKLFSHQAAQVCFRKLKIMKWGFDMEVLAIAKTNKYRIKSYRINDWQAMPHSKFTEGFVRNAFESLWELANILGRRIRGSYKHKHTENLEAIAVPEE